MAILQNQNIVCFGPSDWWGMNPSCATHIMRNFAKTNRVLYINPISSDLLGIRSVNCSLIKRAIRKLKSLVKFVRKQGSELYVFSPFFLPIQGNLILDRINNILIKSQLKLLLFLLKMKHPLLWIENIRAADFMNLDWQFVIYHMSDSFEECMYTKNKDELRKREFHVTKNSDVIICVSRKLYESKKNTKANVHYLPHGVDFKLFDNADENRELFDILPDISPPIAGYFGTLTAQNDIELLEYCAHNLPEITFVFAGQITGGSYGKLISLPNTVFCGKIPYEQIPTLCSTFDLCLLPWKMSKWIASCNPLKLFEYMSSGKPIVSVPINEVVTNYSDVVSIAGNKEDFCKAIKWELENDNRERKEKRISIARENSWTKHVESISEMIRTGLRKKQHRIKKTG